MISLPAEGKAVAFFCQLANQRRFFARGNFIPCENPSSQPDNLECRFLRLRCIMLAGVSPKVAKPWSENLPLLLSDFTLSFIHREWSFLRAYITKCILIHGEIRMRSWLGTLLAYIELQRGAESQPKGGENV